MERFRLLVLSNDSGSDETVYFLDTTDHSPAADFCKPGQTVSYDKLIAADLPGIFPTNTPLQRD